MVQPKEATPNDETSGIVCRSCGGAWTLEAQRPAPKHRLSFADQLVSPNPATDARSDGNLTGVSQAVVLSASSAVDSVDGAQRLPTEKTNGTAKTKTLKSSLRHSTTSPTLAASQSSKNAVPERSTTDASNLHFWAA
ncbi:unnamed protein product [Schistocephalus solidus]|uniref:GATA-type domain-containing protein n=1 Tax=Schistocephalus solidus TaxID=70667 RepID=A0A183T9A0_SCHSO|nr:unnamed protein product [Schistocephalus solidus]